MRARAWQVSTGLFLILAAVFVVGSLFVIFRQAIYIPYQDQWGWVDRYVSRSETVTSLLLTPINSHIVAIPGLLYWMDAALFGASNRLNLIAMMACIAGICLLLRARFSGLAETFRGRTTEIYFGTTLILMVWFHNWENLFWPFQVHLYLSILFSLAALFALSAAVAGGSHRVVGIGIAVALAAGLLAGASFGPGLGVWAPCLLIVLLGRWPAPGKWAVAAAVSCIVALLAWYLLPWVAHESRPIGIVPSLNFLAMFLGSPFYHGYNERVLAADIDRLILPIGAGYLGMALACVIAVRILRIRRRRALAAAELFFVGVMAFALAAAGMVAGVRGGGGPPAPALASRYGVLCLLFWLSAVPLLAADPGFSKARIRSLEMFVPICLLALIVRSQTEYLGWWMNWRSMIEAASASLVSGVPDPEYLGYVLFKPEMVERVSGMLLRERLSPLYEERSRFIGRSLADLGTVDDHCLAQIAETKRLPAGYRISGTVPGPGLPFAELPVFVTDESGRVVGLGNVDRGWSWGFWGGSRVNTFDRGGRSPRSGMAR